MKILHTSDWHVGKVLKGQSRAEEHKQVLAGVIDIARQERPDLVVIAGDLYDTAAPTAEATRLVTRALTALRRTGADVVAIGGNHDNGAALDALRPWAEAAGITLRGRYARTRPSTSSTAPPPVGNAGGWPPCRSCPSGTRSGRWRCTS